MIEHVRVIDISVPIEPGMVVWEDDSAPVVERADSIASGAAFNLSRLAFSAHTGTHLDAPLHFIDGAGATDTIALEALIGTAVVVDARDAEREIDVARVERTVPPRSERVLFATRNSDLWDRGTFTSDFVSISPAAAAALVERGARLIGIDYLSVGSPETHRTLLAAGVAVLEGLDLRGVAAGVYRLVCLPLRLTGSDGSPARAVLAEI